MQLEYEIEITEDFINYRNFMKEEFNALDRSETTRLMHADCLLLEWHMLNSGVAKNPNTKSFDMYLEGYGRVEIKCVSGGGSVTISEWTRRQDFDNYMFYRFSFPRTKPLEVGDKVNLKIVQIESKDSVEKRCRLSKYLSEKVMYYVWAQDGKIAKPNANFFMYKSQKPVYTESVFA
jgi:hypothetical protein